VRKVARYVGISPGTVTKWVKKAKRYGYRPIPTLSSKPKHHPKQLSDELVWKIYHKRLLIKRSAEVVQQELVDERGGGGPGPKPAFSSLFKPKSRLRLSLK
jgi:transposase